MVLVAAVLMPHGVMPFDGDEQSHSPAVRERCSRLDPTFRDVLSQVYDMWLMSRPSEIPISLSLVYFFPLHCIAFHFFPFLVLFCRTVHHCSFIGT